MMVSMPSGYVLVVRQHCVDSFIARFGPHKDAENQIRFEVARAKYWAHKDKDQIIAIYNNLKVYILSRHDGGMVYVITVYPYTKCHRRRVNDTSKYQQIQKL